MEFTFYAEIEMTPQTQEGLNGDLVLQANYMFEGLGMMEGYEAHRMWGPTVFKELSEIKRWAIEAEGYLRKIFPQDAKGINITIFLTEASDENALWNFNENFTEIESFDTGEVLDYRLHVRIVPFEKDQSMSPEMWRSYFTEAYAWSKGYLATIDRELHPREVVDAITNHLGADVNFYSHYETTHYTYVAAEEALKDWRSRRKPHIMAEEAKKLIRDLAEDYTYQWLIDLIRKRGDRGSPSNDVNDHLVQPFYPFWATMIMDHNRKTAGVMVEMDTEALCLAYYDPKSQGFVLFDVDHLDNLGGLRISQEEFFRCRLGHYLDECPPCKEVPLTPDEVCYSYDLRGEL